MSLSVGCVILTMGDRPDELRRAMRSLRNQEQRPVDCVVVSNGAGPVTVPGARTLVLDHNVGIPAGRNRGADEVTGELVLFLDDDAWLAHDEVVGRAVALFANDPRLGVVSLHVTDPDDASTQRRHVPRLRVGDPGRSSRVTTFLGGACLIRRSVLEATGGFPEHFFYAHEETSLAWRAIDAGFTIRYAGDLRVNHPAVQPTRHAVYHELNVRNRILLARGQLPWVLALPYVVVWLVSSWVRDPRCWTPMLRGLRAGLLASVDRDPVSWRAVGRMARAGRPPIV